MISIKKPKMKQKFLTFDIVRTIENEIGFVTDSSFNDSQDEPIHQYNYSIEFLTENKNRYKNAWYNDKELKWTGKNFLELLSQKIGHPFCNKNIFIDLSNQRRRK